MMKTRSLPALVALAVLLLGLGSVGTAMAAPALTKGKVKSIASKVVKKVAPTLSVAHATSANNASNLGGQPPSAYLKNYYSVGLTQDTFVVNFTKNLPSVPNGTYLVSMNISATLNIGSSLFDCILYNAGANVLTADGAPGQGSYATINATKVVTVTGPLSVFCESRASAISGPGSTTFSSPVVSYPPNAITFTKLDAGTSLGSAT